MSLMLENQRKHEQAKQQGKQLQEAAPTGSTSTHVESGVMQSTQLNVTLDMALKQDFIMLKGINSRDRRAEVKLDLIEKYRPHVERMAKSGDRHEVQGWFLIWLFDTGSIHEAVHCGMWCIANNIPLPERFNRATEIFIVDEVLEWADGEFEEENSIEPYFSFIFENADGFCSKPWNLPDEVTAKLYRLHGLRLFAEEKYAAAADALAEAFALGAKVKTKLDKARNKAAALEEENAA
ncbi:phage terminase small subunit (plasmid) [Halodesulfovibrio aestuarii]|uniref:Phage small terminase subunit n=1 Tax=Halodesulfovibrio aestuarii TaxID=126333 RepID=A0A8G2CC50_9BACT|nr:phage terminase small subunit [Halodesulfovibrio aestuarii]SHJ71944.1 Phage small terminase subunit [Halodesulfovibrio aestuarii]